MYKLIKDSNYKAHLDYFDINENYKKLVELRTALFVK